MDNELLHIARILENVYGMDISKYDEAFFERAVGNRLMVVETKKSSDYIKYLSNSSYEAAALFQSLINTHTEFFRNSLTFAQLEHWILPRLMEDGTDKNELRIWSAGCSTGQEAYSIAMIIENINSNKKEKRRYRIIATDISNDAIRAAAKAEYNERAIQRIRTGDLKEFFVKSGEVYQVSDRLKKNVGFSRYDLLDNSSAFPQESIFGNFDLVVCSNILFYYKPSYQQSILNKLINSMDKQGYLITDEAEKQIVLKFTNLVLVAPPSPIFKQGRGVK